MKRYNKFYNVSLGNFLKVACCSLSIITIASCEEEPFEQDSSSESELLQAANALRTALEKSGSDISIAYLDDIENLDTQKAQDLCKNLEEIKNNKSINDEVKNLAANLGSKCKKFFDRKKEENKPTDDKPSQEEPKLNKAAEWKKVEEVVNNLITKYESVGKQHPHLKTFIENGKRLCDSDSDYSDLRDFNYALNGLVSDKEVFQTNPDVLGLINKVESEVNAFINKLDKAEEWKKIDKAEKWKKIENDVRNLISKLTELGKADFCSPLDSIIKIGEDLYKKDFDDDLRRCFNFKFLGDEDRKKLEADKKYEDCLVLLTKVESAIDAFINKFGKSAPAGDSNVSK